MSELDTLERHPWNTSFEWQPHDGPHRQLTDAQANQFDELGFVVVEDAVDPPTLARVTAEIDAFEAELETSLRTQADDRIFIAEADAITFTTHLVARSEEIRRLATSAVFVNLCSDLVGPDVNMYWDQAVYKKPEKPRRFPWHQDNGYTFIEPQQYLTCWVALTDVDESNGCPWVVPGTHRLGTLRHWMTDLGWRCLERADNAVAVPARAGSIIVFSSLTPHRTGPNRTSEVRKAYIVQFAPDGARLAPSGSGAASMCDDPVLQFPILVDGDPPEARTPLSANPPNFKS